MKIYIASDHAGYNLKNELVRYLIALGHEVNDCGPYEYNEEDDYPDYVAEVAAKVSEDPEQNWGVVIGGSGQGEAVMANRFPNVRAVVYNGESQSGKELKAPDEITIMREHNNANVLSLGAWFLSDTEAENAVTRWLSTPFKGEERHLRRLHKIEALAPKSNGETDFNLEL